MKVFEQPRYLAIQIFKAGALAAATFPGVAIFKRLIEPGAAFVDKAMMGLAEV